MEEPKVADRSDPSSAIVPQQTQESTDAAQVTGAPEEAHNNNYLSGVKLISIIAAVCLAVFCVALDNTVCHSSRFRH